MLEEMLRSRHEPGVINYNMANNDCQMGQQWEQGLSLRQAMWRFRLELDRISYIATIAACDGSGASCIVVEHVEEAAPVVV